MLKSLGRKARQLERPLVQASTDRKGSAVPVRLLEQQTYGPHPMPTSAARL
jgi:hypothetical protein